MKTQVTASSVLGLLSLLGLATLGGIGTNSALAQGDPRPHNDDSGPMGGPGGRGPLPVPPEMRPGVGTGQMLMAFGPANVAVNNSFVYVLRGTTLYQMRATDLTLVTQRELPAPAHKK